MHLSLHSAPKASLMISNFRETFVCHVVLDFARMALEAANFDNIMKENRPFPF